MRILAVIFSGVGSRDTCVSKKKQTSCAAHVGARNANTSCYFHGSASYFLHWKYIAAACQIQSYTWSAFLHNSIKDCLISISGSKYHSEAQPNSTSNAVE